VTVSERLTQFVRAQLDAGVPEHATHEAKRLLLNQLKASLGTGGHPAIEILNGWAAPAAPGVPSARVLWLGTEASPEQAAFVNGAMFEVLDFHDTYIPTYLHAVSGVLPAALALAEAEGRSGRDLAIALALGIEVELAIATILMPTGYFRGFVPLGLVGSTGAAAACSVLGKLDDEQTRNALGLAMCTAGGVYETVGSMGLPYVTGHNTRAGLTAYELAVRGFDAPVTAFEGEKGMLASYSDEPASKIDEVMATLGEEWRIHGQSYKTMPTETITHAPVECTLRVRERAGDREIERMTFGVEPIVVKIADERRDRFGEPSSDLEARFDLRHCVAAAWQRGRFTRAEMSAPAYTDPAVLDLRSRVELVADEQRKTFDGCWLEATFTDGSSESITTDAFRGSAANPMSDDELADLFRTTAEGHLAATRADEIVAAVMGLEAVANVRELIDLLTR
jgi:2-methylcitrate dehydratase PrpD